MQARAIFGAAVEAGRTAPSKKFPVAEIMVPLVASVGEFKIIKQIIDKTAAAIQKEDPSFPRENMEKKQEKHEKKSWTSCQQPINFLEPTISNYHHS